MDIYLKSTKTDKGRLQECIRSYKDSMGRKWHMYSQTSHRGDGRIWAARPQRISQSIFNSKITEGGWNKY